MREHPRPDMELEKAITKAIREHAANDADGISTLMTMSAHAAHAAGITREGFLSACMSLIDGLWGAPN